MTNKYLIPLLTVSILACSISPVRGQENTQPDTTFSCENNNGIPITVAINEVGTVQTIFHWKEEVLQLTTKTPLKLCDTVSNKMNEFSAKGYDLSSFGLTATELDRLLIICLNEKTNQDCSKILFTAVSQQEKSIVAAHNILKIILDPEIVQIDLAARRSSERDVFTGYRIDLLELFKNKQ